MVGILTTTEGKHTVNIRSEKGEHMQAIVTTDDQGRYLVVDATTGDNLGATVGHSHFSTRWNAMWWAQALSVPEEQNSG